MSPPHRQTTAPITVTVIPQTRSRSTNGGDGSPGFCPAPAWAFPTVMLIPKKPLAFWLSEYGVRWVGLKVPCLCRFYFSHYLCNRLVLLQLTARREKLHLSGDVVKEGEVGRDHSVETAALSGGPRTADAAGGIPGSCLRSLQPPPTPGPPAEGQTGIRLQEG